MSLCPYVLTYRYPDIQTSRHPDIQTIMRLSEEKITHIAHLVCDRLYHDDLVDYPNDEEALRFIKKTILNYLQIDDQIDEEVRRKITSLKKGVTESSREWEILHKKYYEEESQKRNF